MPSANKPTPIFNRRLYMMRHGDVSYFDAEGRPFPHNQVALNERGLEQARKAGEALAGVHLDRIISSDLPRTIGTAQAVASGRSVELEQRPELREIQPGRLADVPPEGLTDHFLKAFNSSITRESRFLGGESFGSLLDRVGGFWKALVAEATWSSILVVAHGGVNRALMAQALGLDLRFLSAIEQDPGCLNILDLDSDGRAILRLLNFTPYDAIKDHCRMTTMEDLFHQFMKGRRR